VIYLMRYRRQAVYNYDKKQWQTFYYDKTGKIKFDSKIKTYQDAKKEIKKNQYVKLNDLINKKESKIEYHKINNKVQNQKRIDKLIKKEKLTKIEKKELRELALTSGYKKKQLSKKVKSKKKPETIQSYTTHIPTVYCSTTSTFFYVMEKDFKRIKKEIKLTFKGYKPDRLQVEIDGMTGNINYSELNNLRSFESAISWVISGHGHIDWQKDLSKLKFSLIKR
jgi:hypothetical protein